MDTIYLHGIKCPCTIGVWEWEKAITQTLVLDIDLASDNKKAAQNDDLKDAINYQALAKRVQSYAQDNAFELIETLVERLAEIILAEFETPWVKIRCDKGQAVAGVGHVGVMIERGNKPHE